MYLFKNQLVNKKILSETQLEIMKQHEEVIKIIEKNGGCG